MRHIEAVSLVVLELLKHSVSPEVKEAMSLLSEHSWAVEELADGYIAEIDNGILTAWEEAYDPDDPEGSVDERLFDSELANYETAHILVGREIGWPEGYEEQGNPDADYLYNEGLDYLQGSNE